MHPETRLTGFFCLSSEWMDFNAKQSETGCILHRGINLPKSLPKQTTATHHEVMPQLMHCNALHRKWITACSRSPQTLTTLIIRSYLAAMWLTEAWGPIHKSVKPQAMVMTRRQPIRTEAQTGLCSMFYKRWFLALLVIPANKKPPGAFLFCLHCAVRADNHSGLKHSSVCFLYLGNNSCNLTSAHNLEYTSPRAPIRS